MGKEDVLEYLDFGVGEPDPPEEQTNKKHCKGVEYINTTKVSTALTTREAKEKTVKVHEYGEKTEKNRQSFTIMSLYSRVLNMSNVVITPFDINILDCVYSMIKNGQSVFTIEQLANTLMKKEVKFDSIDVNYQDTFEAMKLTKEANPELSEEQLNFYNRLHLSIMKLSNVTVRLDCSRMKAPDGEKVFDRHIKYGYLLPMEIDEYESPVKKEQRIKYTMIKKSILYQYAERLNRVAVVPAKMLDTGLPASVDGVVLGREIAKIITIMKNPHNHYSSRDITYEWKKGGEEKGLFARIGLKKESYPSPQSWSRKKRQIHKMIGEILEKYKQDGIITDYHENINGKSKVGYHIDI